MSFDAAFFVRTFFTALAGAPVSLLMTAGALLISVPLGFVVAVTRVNRIPVLKELAALYVSFIRGTPVMVQIFIAYSAFPAVLKNLTERNGWDIDVYKISPIVYAIVILGVNIATHFSEIFRSALLSVPAGQREAAHAMGFTTFQTYCKFVIPQAFVVAAPSFCTSSMNMLKNTSLAFMIGVMDVVGRAKTAAGIGYRYFEAYIDIFIVYLILCLLYEKFFNLFVKRVSVFQRGTVGR